MSRRPCTGAPTPRFTPAHSSAAKGRWCIYRQEPTNVRGSPAHLEHHQLCSYRSFAEPDSFGCTPLANHVATLAADAALQSPPDFARTAVASVVAADVDSATPTNTYLRTNTPTHMITALIRVQHELTREHTWTKRFRHWSWVRTQTRRLCQSHQTRKWRQIACPHAGTGLRRPARRTMHRKHRHRCHRGCRQGDSTGREHTYIDARRLGSSKRACITVHGPEHQLICTVLAGRSHRACHVASRLRARRCCISILHRSRTSDIRQQRRAGRRCVRWW